jgi:hypothetical protein
MQMYRLGKFLVCVVLTTLLFTLVQFSSKAETPSPAATANRNFGDCLLPAPKNGGFAMEGYYLWCASVVKVDDTYHMFASRWPAKYGMGGWTGYSECVRATSTNLCGPYTFQEVVLRKRIGAWDRSRVHNVKIVKAGGKFVLYYINTANETGYAVADSVTGPWKRSDRVAMPFSNPAPLVRPDLSIYCFGRFRDSSGVNRGQAYTAPSFEGPYTLVQNGDNLLPNGGELEDPTIWWADNQYNIIVNDWKGHATGTNKAGAEYCSPDGVHYKLVTSKPAFTKTVKYDDGSSETFSRRERPFVYLNERGEVIALFTACLPQNGDARVLAQPVDRYFPAGGGK